MKLRTEPNFEGVLMTNCGKNGLEDFKVVTGSQGILGVCSELYQVPKFEQKNDMDPFEVSSSDGGQFKVDPTYRYKLIEGRGPNVVFEFKHAGPSTQDSFLDNVENIILDNLVKDAYKEIARRFSTTGLINGMANFELTAETLLEEKFKEKHFELLSLTSGLQPPQSTVNAIEAKNNALQEAETVKNQIELTQFELEKARIEAQRDIERSKGLNNEILTLKWIEALTDPNSKIEKIIIVTDGKTPVIIQN